MQSPLSSQARLADPESISLLKRVMFKHGVTGFGRDYEAVEEANRLRVVPLVFGLLPIQAVRRQESGELIKPYIRQHLENCCSQYDEELVTIVKRISDQFFETRTSDGFVRKRKLGIADVKARNPSLYRQLLSNQNGRCAICGRPFDSDSIEELDHMVPWRLIGDVPDGSNWQILCGLCNKGKGEWISALQSSESLNWAYRGGDNLAETPTLETRYVVLALRPFCDIPGCGKSRLEDQMHVVRKGETGLAVADHLVARCSNHVSA